MTTNNTPRRSRRPLGYGSGGNGTGNGRMTVGERLRDAREVRGLDLYRVERDTKIRHKYLAAIEAGDYADLPGDVYARGFLRNYATYLGMDPDEIVEEWRSESGTGGTAAAAPSGAPILGAPRPMAVPRRGLMLQPSHMVLIAVVIVVAMVGIYFGYQVSRFLSVPTLSVGCPGASGAISTRSASTSGIIIVTPVPVTSGVAGCSSSSDGAIHITAATGATTYYLTGTATAGSTVYVRWNGQDPKKVDVDDGGHWSFQAVLTPGQNEFDITAQNIDTNHQSKQSVVFIFVPNATPTPAAPVVTFTSPADGALITDANVIISGSTKNVTSVTLTTAYLGAPPAPGATLPPGAYSSAQPVATATSTAAAATPTPNPSASSPVQGPLATEVMANGDFTFSTTLAPGVWRLSVVGQGPTGLKSAVVSHVVAVPTASLVVLVKVSGGSSWLRLSRDGTALKQGTFSDGYSYTMYPKKNACVQAGSPGRVQIVINGGTPINMGTLGKTVYVDTAHGARAVSTC